MAPETQFNATPRKLSRGIGRDGRTFGIAGSRSSEPLLPVFYSGDGPDQLKS